MKSFKIPKEKGYKLSWFARIFAAREVVVVRASGACPPCRVRLSPAAQALAVLAFVGLSAWAGYAHWQALRTIERLSVGGDAAATLSAYNDLKRDLSVYKAQIAKLGVRLDHNYRQIMAALDDAGTAASAPGNPSDKGTVAIVNHLKASLEAGRSAAAALPAGAEGKQNDRVMALLADRARINGEVAFLGAEIDRLVAGGRIIPSDGKDDAQSLRRAMIQRDLASFEAKELRAKVLGLESMVTDMQTAQIMVFERMGSLADGGLHAVESKLADIKGVMQHAGLGFEWLVARAAEQRAAGETRLASAASGGIVASSQGGPLIPVSVGAQLVPTMKSEHLSRAYGAVSERVQRWDSMARLLKTLPLGMPLKYVRITSRYGVRSDPMTSASAVHEGLDFGALRGEPVHAPSAGTVVYAGSAGSYGLMLEIDHGMGIKTRYAHLDSMDVAVGDRVAAGQKIAEVGNTGRSTGAHLHYEVRVRGRPVNPMNFAKIVR
ncbi:peptidase M23 [Alphaproteobacteria bacterium]|nr:peptidase M23 [Alphaproteobacteria bacterium]